MSKKIMGKQTCKLFQSLNLWLSLGYWESFKSLKNLDFRRKWISKVQLLWILFMEKHPALSCSHFSETTFIFGPWAVGNFHERCAHGTAQSCAGCSQHTQGQKCPVLLPEAAFLLQAVHSPALGGLHRQSRFLPSAHTQLTLKSLHFIPYLIADVCNLIGFLCVSYSSAGFRNI